MHADLPLIGNVWKINLGDLDKLVAAGTGVPDDEVERRRTLAKGYLDFENLYTYV